MIEKLTNEIIQDMLPYLNNVQISLLSKVLNFTLKKYVNECECEGQDIRSDKLLRNFIEAKRIEGCSEKTLIYYENTINNLLDATKKEVVHIMTEDLRKYLTAYHVNNKLSRVTVDNIRRIISSFFSWLEDEDYIIKSPVRRIRKIRTTEIVRETYTDEQMEIMRDNCKELRDLAIIDVLASTGMRIGEMVSLNRQDINFFSRECTVLGKGNKERIVYLDARAKIHLQNYLNSRIDKNEALFVSLRYPYARISIGGIEIRFRKLGERLGINKVHPHKFRRTLATRAIDKGMPIEQLQKLLGHKRIDTTLRYAMVKQNNVKIAHKKYLS